MLDRYNSNVSTALIAGIDSAIGKIIASSLTSSSWKVLGTSRRAETVNHSDTFFCDFSEKNSIDECANSILRMYPEIDILVIAIGILEPIGKYSDINFNEWEKGFYVNCLGRLGQYQLRGTRVR